MGVQVITSDQQANRGFLIGTALARGLNETAQTLLAIATRREEARQRDEALQARVAQAAEALEERRMRREELGAYRQGMLALMAQGQANKQELGEARLALDRDIANANMEYRTALLDFRRMSGAARVAGTHDRESGGGGGGAPTSLKDKKAWLDILNKKADLALKRKKLRGEEGEFGPTPPGTPQATPLAADPRIPKGWQVSVSPGPAQPAAQAGPPATSGPPQTVTPSSSPAAMPGAGYIQPGRFIQPSATGPTSWDRFWNAFPGTTPVR